MKQKLKENLLKWIVIVSVLALVGISLTKWWNQPSVADSGNFEVMGTVAHIITVAPDRKVALAGIKSATEQIRQLERTASVYDPESDLSFINNNAGEKPVPIEPALYEIIDLALKYAKLSEGALDITVRPLIDLYKQAAVSGTPPTQEQIETVREKVGYQKIILDPHERTIYFDTKGVKLDLGAIAKGFAIDTAARALRQAGCLGAMIDIGGDILCFGQKPPGRKHWLIGLQDPSEEENIRMIIKLNDQAVTTSGDYRRFFFINAKKYSHIMDPALGRPGQSLTSVTVIGPDAASCDALSTAISVMGEKKGLDLIESLQKYEAILIPARDRQTIIKSSGADQYIHKIIDTEKSKQK